MHLFISIQKKICRVLGIQYQYSLPFIQLYSNLRYFINIFRQFLLASSRSSIATAKLHSWRPEHHLSSSGRTSLVHPKNSSASVIQRPTDIRPNSADVTNIISSLLQDIRTCSEIQTSISSANIANANACRSISFVFFLIVYDTFSIFIK